MPATAIANLLCTYVRTYLEHHPWDEVTPLLAAKLGDVALAQAIVGKVRVGVMTGTQWPVIEGDVQALLDAAAPTPEDPPSADGFTDFPEPGPADRIVYVNSATGDDFWQGSNPAQAVRTIEKAKLLVRDGHADWCLLESGGTYGGPGPTRWEAGGRSPTEPLLLAARGVGPRPVLLGGLLSMGGGPLSCFAAVGLELASTPTSEGGLFWIEPGDHLTFEDLLVRTGAGGLCVEAVGSATARQRDVRVRRCIVLDQSAPENKGHVQGGYFYGIDGLLLEENVFDGNGMPADIFRHNVYVQNGCTAVAVRRNIIAHASSHGMQLRPGGEVLDNLFIRNPINLHVGGGNDPEPAGVLADVRRNVVLGGGDIDPSNKRGWALSLSNIRQGQVNENLLADGTGGFQFPLMIDGRPAGDHKDGLGGCHVVIDRNVRRGWACSDHPDKVAPGYLRAGDAVQLAGTVVSDMQERADLVGVDLALDTYLPSFLARARQREHGVWDAPASAAALNKWARARVGIPA